MKNRQFYLFGDCPIGSPILQGSQVVAVYAGIGVTRIGAEFIAGDDANFAVRIGARSNEADGCRNDKIALDFFPKKMKLIGLIPHVEASTFQGVLLGFGVVGRSAF